jgi:demethylmenaquinone methyltransferase/2-methoxy-6-polyprenyl-1,4-benzoquinol methylase
VLKPDGRIIILEFTRPNSRLGLWLTRQYFRHAVPLMARLVTRSADSEVLMNYCWDTIAGCVEPATILASLKSSGFFDIERRVISGVFGEYTARKRRPLSAVG